MDSALRIVDFGFAKRCNNEISSPSFSYFYSPPECFSHNKTHTAQDVWSLGVILYTMLMGTAPFITKNDAQIGRIDKGVVFWQVLSDEAKDLIVNLIQIDATKRLTLSQIFNHAWLCDKM